MGTYTDDDEIKNCPETGEVLFESKGEPLEYHLNEEEDSKDNVQIVENFDQSLFSVQSYILKNTTLL